VGRLQRRRQLRPTYAIINDRRNLKIDIKNDGGEGSVIKATTTAYRLDCRHRWQLDLNGNGVIDVGGTGDDGTLPGIAVVDGILQMERA